MRNIKDSAFPYFMEQIRFAKISFDMFGALTPSEEPAKSNSERFVSQSELECSMFKVSFLSHVYYNINNKKHFIINSYYLIFIINNTYSYYYVCIFVLLKKINLCYFILQFDGTFSEHLEIFIQFGYVVMFSSAFPLAALCALLNNLIEIRSDAFKLCYVYQRPFGQRIKDIGMWQVYLQIYNNIILRIIIVLY